MSILQKDLPRRCLKSSNYKPLKHLYAQDHLLHGLKSKLNNTVRAQSEALEIFAEENLPKAGQSRLNTWYIVIVRIVLQGVIPEGNLNQQSIVLAT